jgi:dipeptidyl aminopeptidase/acylaminoacyl peptidase
MKTTQRLGRYGAPKVMHGLRFTSMQCLLHPMALVGVLLALASPSSTGTVSPRRLLEVADFSAPVVSPDGARVAFRVEQASVERNTYDTTWYVQDMDGSAPPRRVADGGVPLRDSAGVSQPSSVIWSPDGGWIYYRARLNDRIDVWRAAADGSGAEPLTLNPADVRDFSLSADGNTLLYSVGATRQAIIDAEQTEYDRGVRIDESVPIGQGLFRAGDNAGRWATLRHDIGSNRVGLLAGVHDRWGVIDLTSRVQREALPSEQPVSAPMTLDLAEAVPTPWLLVPEPDGSRIALLTRTEGKPGIQLSMLPGRQARRPVACQAEACTDKAITGIEWRPVSDEVLFTVTDPQQGLAQSVFRWNVRTGAVHPVVRATGLISGGRDRFSACGVSSDALACITAKADTPPRLERINLETGQRQVLFDPNAALARDIAATSPVRLLRWTSKEGQAFTGQFFQARATGDLLPPLFVTYYSCPGFLRGGVGDEWPLATLAEQGISALCIDQVQNGPSDRVELYNQALSGVESVIALLASEGAIDRTRVGMGGLSFGSAVTLWVAAESELLSAVSVTSPVVSPNYYLFNSLRGDAFLTALRDFWQLGALDETPKRWRKLSPVFALEKLKTPMLLQMPEQEYLYALEYAIPLMREHHADLYVFPNEPHQKFQPRHKLAVYERNLDWFRFWLQAHEDPDPAKAEQYAHWRQMKAATGQ